MAKEYNVPWKIEGNYIVTGNGKIHKDDIEKIVNQRDHEVNNLRTVNQCLELKINRGIRPNRASRQNTKMVRKYIKTV